MKDLGVSFFTGYDIGDTASTGTSWPPTRREMVPDTFSSHPNLFKGMHGALECILLVPIEDILLFHVGGVYRGVRCDER